MSRLFEVRLLPQTAYILLPAVLSAMAWVAAMFQDGCDYSRVTGPSVQSMTGSDMIPFADVGRAGYRVPLYYEKEIEWRVPYTETCASHGAGVDTSGWVWKLSKTMSFLAMAFGGGGSLFLWLGGCTVLSRTMWRAAGVELLIAFVCQSLAFLWFLNPLCNAGGDGNRCALHFGAKSDAVAATLWATSAAAVFMKYPTPRAWPKLVPAADEEGETAGMIGSHSNLGSIKGQGSQISFGDGYGVSERQWSSHVRRY